MMRDIELQKFETFEEEVQCLENCRVMYECMYHRDGEFEAEYGDTSVDEKLNIMESFVRVTPMSIKRLTRAAKWCSYVTAVTLTKTMRVCIPGCSPCCRIWK
jgi:hypothetical protein